MLKTFAREFLTVFGAGLVVIGLLVGVIAGIAGVALLASLIWGPLGILVAVAGALMFLGLLCAGIANELA